MERHNAQTTAWTSDELTRIDAADELEIAPRRRDGSLRRPVPIWVVRVADGLHAKYDRFASIVDAITNAQARSTTLRLVPRAQSNG